MEKIFGHAPRDHVAKMRHGDESYYRLDNHKRWLSTGCGLAHNLKRPYTLRSSPICPASRVCTVDSAHRGCARVIDCITCAIVCSPTQPSQPALCQKCSLWLCRCYKSSQEYTLRHTAHYRGIVKPCRALTPTTPLAPSYKKWARHLCNCANLNESFWSCRLNFRHCMALVDI